MQEESAAYHLFRFGRLTEAARAVQGNTDDAALAVELAYLFGRSDHVRSEARRIVQSRSASRISKVRALRTLGNQFRDDGLFPEALELFRTAVNDLKSTDTPLDQALAYCALLEGECDSSAFDASRSTALSTRRIALRSGDPSVLALTHHTFGRLEARVGNLDRALRHFAMARHLLEAANPFLRSAIDLDESSTRSLLGEFPEALALATAAFEAASSSGWSKGIVAAAANCGSLCGLLGRTQEAEAHLAVAEKQTFTSANYQLSILETRTQLALAKHDYKEAEELLGSRHELVKSAGRWYSLTVDDTEIRALTRQGRWAEAVRKADEALSIASKYGAKPFLVTLRMRRALAIAGSGGKIRASDIPTTAEWSDWSLESQGTFWLVRARISSPAEQASAYAKRALHIFQGIGDRNAEFDAQAVVNATSQRSSPSPTLDSAVALIEVAGHPHILAREAFALLEGSGCVTAAALIARGTKTLRVLDTRGWDEREALQAARKEDSTETIECGTHRDEALQIIAKPLDDLEQRCTWIAIKKLVVTALTLDRYRRDEKQRAALWPADSLEGDPDILWVSETVNEVVRVARRIGPTPLSVLLTGETGTGKEMLAKTIHLASGRADKILLAFNCTAVPRDMLESQLFGYRKGAFTGADTSFTGVIRAAEGGTLFLDEIADMPIDLQPKLLRFLETHEIHPLGEPHPIKVDVRVLAATNASLEALVAEGRFRQDLFYRLNVVRLRLPPLRERREEIPALVEHYIRRYGDQQKKGRLTLTDEALEYLLLYAWPGNLRQLANEVNRMVAMAEPDAALTAAHLSAEIQATRRTIPASSAPGSELRISLDQSLPSAVELLERTMVQSALDRSKGRLEEAAKILGISRKGLFLKRRRWGLQQA